MRNEGQATEATPTAETVGNFTPPLADQDAGEQSATAAKQKRAPRGPAKRDPYKDYKKYPVADLKLMVELATGNPEIVKAKTERQKAKKSFDHWTGWLDEHDLDGSGVKS